MCSEENKTPYSYDPSWLVRLAEKQLPDKPEIAEALKKCTIVVSVCACGCGDPYFIDPNSKDWNFDRNEILEREDGIDIVFSIMKDGRIGAIEIGEYEKKI